MLDVLMIVRTRHLSLARNVRGLLFVERLMPQTGWNVRWVGWRWSMVHLLGVAGRYRSIIEWAGLSPTIGQTAKWVGSCESSAYTLTRVAAYLAANGVTYHDADDAWAWGQTHLQELRGQYLGDDNPELDTIHNEVEADARHASGEAVSHSCEQILTLAVSRGVEPHLIPPLVSSGECEENSDWQDQMADTHVLYMIPPALSVMQPSSAMDVDQHSDYPPLEDGKVDGLFEGPAPM